MSITITDPLLLEQLRAVTGTVDVRGPDGTVVATLSPPNKYTLPPGVTSPFTDEEMAERRKDRTTTARTLADIVRDLEARG